MDRPRSSAERRPLCHVFGTRQPAPIHRIRNDTPSIGVIATYLSTDSANAERIWSVTYGSGWEECGIVDVGHGTDVCCGRQG